MGEFNEWLNKESNGCIARKNLAGIQITAKYLPSNYMILKSFVTASKKVLPATRDSILSLQKKQINFLLTIEPDKEDKERRTGSVVYQGVNSYQGYVERLMMMNFFMDQHVKLYLDNSVSAPVFATMENVYELSEGRNFLIVFNRSVEDIKKSKELFFVYDDPFFSMGKVQLNFNAKDFLKAESLPISW